MFRNAYGGHGVEGSTRIVVLEITDQMAYQEWRPEITDQMAVAGDYGSDGIPGMVAGDYGSDGIPLLLRARGQRGNTERGLEITNQMAYQEWWPEITDQMVLEITNQMAHQEWRPEITDQMAVAGDYGSDGIPGMVAGDYGSDGIPLLRRPLQGEWCTNGRGVDRGHWLTELVAYSDRSA